VKSSPTQPQVEPPIQPDQLSAWWQDWVQFVRNAPGRHDEVDGATLFWGEHLFIGCETHRKLGRVARAFGRQAPSFSDTLEYHEVADLRVWGETTPSTLLLHEKILAEHCYIVGPSGAGKSSLGIMPLLVQLIRGAKTKEDKLPDPYPVVVLDLKGDSALFHTVRLEAARRNQPFQFFTTDKQAPTYRFNPFRGFDRGSRTVAQLCQLILDALNLNHGKGYGRSYYTERSRNVLSRTLKRNRNIQSFDELHTELRETVMRADARTKGDAFELLSVIEILTEYRQLVTDPDETISSTDGIIFMPTVLKERQVVYFWLPAALESISVGEIAKLVLFNLRVAAQDWKRAHPDDARNVILVIDELQRVAGENLQGILQDARSFGIHAILANQSLSDLKSPTGFDLAPTIMTNTRVKFFFTSPSERECYVYVERGKGFTEARQFPQKGNPWLKELSPEEFAYHVRLAWPIPWEEYKTRDALPMPSWDEVPGGNFYESDNGVPIEEEEEPLSDILPFNFKLIRDAEWETQVAAIQALFEPESLAGISGTLFEESEEVPRSAISTDDLNRIRQGILDSINERGPDRSKCLVNLLFDNYVNGVERVPTWEDLWKECWGEPLSSLRGANIQPAATLRQAVSRVRDYAARYFADPISARWPFRAVIELSDYRLRFVTVSPPTSDESGFPPPDPDD
jgi:hypothetical protein